MADPTLETPQVSPAIQKAFDVWQATERAFQIACDADANVDITMGACEVEHEAFMRVLTLAPQTIADVRLQAKLLAKFFEMCKTERPLALWLSTLTEDAMQHGSAP